MTGVALADRPGEVVVTVTMDNGYAYRLVGTPPPPGAYLGGLGDPIILLTCRR